MILYRELRPYNALKQDKCTQEAKQQTLSDIKQNVSN